MAQEDRFSLATKRTIAQRVGFHCSYPGCQVVTIGPNDAASRTSSIGTAAHIAGAEKGAMRYDASMNSAQRSDAANGIWMCENHGKLIDTDEARFKTALLLQWKELAEDIHRLAQEKGVSWTEASAIKRGMKHLENERVIDALGSEGELIGEMFIDSALEISWGRDMMHAVRDAVAEHVRNALSHGGANQVQVFIRDRSVQVIDDGNTFSHRDLLGVPNGRGGHLTMKHVVDHYGDELIITSHREDDGNRLSIGHIKSPLDIGQMTPCYVRIDSSRVFAEDAEHHLDHGCQDVFVVLGRHLMMSAALRLAENASLLRNEARPLTFIGAQLSDLVKAKLKESFPGSRVISL